MVILERFVAIDNVCAWPNLTKMTDGSVVASIYNQPVHGRWEGDVECWASDGNCRLWKLRGTAAIHEPTCNRMNVAAGLAANGDLIVIASGWTNAGKPGTVNEWKNKEIIPPLVCRSKDGGKTWERKEGVKLLEGKTPYVIPFGDIIKLSSGELGVCIYSWDPPQKEQNSRFYVSRDDGYTWEYKGLIGENINETAPLVLPDGEILAAARTMGDQHLELFCSRDNGVTWTNLMPLTLGNQHPAHMLLLKNGKILLTYGIRNKGLYGIGGRISADMGRSWESPFVLADFQIAFDGGYPSSVECEDGCIATACYASGIPFHQRYHMGVVRWRID